MSRIQPDGVIAHVELLRSVDRLLTAAEVVRQKRAALDRLLRDESPQPAGAASARGEGAADE
jgi:hypothetical protein